MEGNCQLNRQQRRTTEVPSQVAISDSNLIDAEIIESSLTPTKNGGNEISSFFTSLAERSGEHAGCLAGAGEALDDEAQNGGYIAGVWTFTQFVPGVDIASDTIAIGGTVLNAIIGCLAS
jgi:hypothetical protein